MRRQMSPPMSSRTNPSTMNSSYRRHHHPTISSPPSRHGPRRRQNSKPTSRRHDRPATAERSAKHSAPLPSSPTIGSSAPESPASLVSYSRPPGPRPRPRPSAPAQSDPSKNTRQLRLQSGRPTESTTSSAPSDAVPLAAALLPGADSALVCEAVAFSGFSSVLRGALSTRPTRPETTRVFNDDGT